MRRRLRGRLGIALLPTLALVAGGVAGDVAHGRPQARLSSADAVVGAVQAAWSCAFCGSATRPVPALSFSQGSCPRRTIAVGNGHDGLIPTVLPAGSYRVGILPGNEELIEPERHATVEVEAGRTTDLGAMRPKRLATAYPLFCN